MDNTNIWSHITRRISGETTGDDTQHIDKWLKEKPVNRQIYRRLVEMWNSERQTVNKHESLFESIWRRIKVYESKPSLPFYKHSFFRAAAVLFFVVTSNFLVFTLMQGKMGTQHIVYNEVVVPPGNRMKLTLPDSTLVWLSNDTKLRYANNYSRENRAVELSGEAFFDVCHDANHPFVVNIGKQKIKVLGTKFSVDAYPDDSIIETSLIEGSVEFDSHNKVGGKSQFMLEPGNSLFYDKKDSTISIKKTQSSYYEYWDKGIYVFKDESFEDLAVKIKRIFNVEVVFENEYLKKKTFTGTININDNIFLFMESIKKTSVDPIEYKFSKNIMYVNIKN